MLREAIAALTGMFSASAGPGSFEAGQVWRYRARPGERDSRLYIVKVDSPPNGERIFHIHLDKLKIDAPMNADGVQPTLQATVSLQTLKLSVTRLQGKTDVLPDLAEGYSEWKKDLDEGRAVGVFTISVREIISLTEAAASQFPNPQS